jgi:hypothetical protein
MPMTVPMQRGGSKSLPAELKVGGHNPVIRMQASGAGYGMNGASRIQPYMVRSVGMRGLRGLGDDDTPIDLSNINGVDLTPTGSIAPGGSISLYTDPSTGQMYSTDANGNVTAIGTPTTAPFSSVSIPVSYTGTPPAGYTGPTQVAPNVTPPAAPAGYQWASLLNSTGQTLAKVLAISQGGSSVTLPNGTQLVYGSAASSVAGSGSSLFTSSTALGGLSIGTLGLLAVGVFFVMSMGKR